MRIEYKGIYEDEGLSAELSEYKKKDSDDAQEVIKDVGEIAKKYGKIFNVGNIIGGLEFTFIG